MTLNLTYGAFNDSNLKHFLLGISKAVYYLMCMRDFMDPSVRHIFSKERLQKWAVHQIDVCSLKFVSTHMFREEPFYAGLYHHPS